MKNKKIAVCIVLIIVCLLALCGCSCKHTRTHKVTTKSPTCTQSGLEKVVCDDCKKVVDDNIERPATGHSDALQALVTKFPNCTESGEMEVYCSLCKELLRTETIPAFGHKTSEVVYSEPTCATDGYKESVCSVCKQVVSYGAIDAVGHDYGQWQIVKNPTETENGIELRVCDNDSSHLDTRLLPMLTAENYDVVTIEPECNSAGSRVYFLKSDAETQFTVIIPALSHTYDSGKVGYCSVCGDKYFSKGLTYTLSDDGSYYSVSNTNNTLTDNYVVIPDYYNGLPVKAIASEGFAYRNWIKGVSIPSTVEQIGAGAFNGCNLEQVYFNAANCQDLNGRNWVFYPTAETIQNISVVIGNAVRRIPARLFFPLSSDTSKTPTLNSLTFEEGSVCKEIGEYAFYKTGITSLTLPDSVEKVNDFAFYGTAVNDVTLGSGVKTLGNSAFDSCRNLMSVKFNFVLNEIGNDCFNFCDKLKQADMSQTSIVSLGYDAFKCCYALNNVKLPSSVQSIGKEAFYNCAALTIATLGDELQTLGSKAFYGCSALKQITIPSKVTQIGDSAFENCAQLSTLVFAAKNCADFSQGNKVFANVAKDGKISVVFAEGVTHIPARMFYGTANVSCLPHIDSLTISSTVTTVGDNAFFGVSIDKVFRRGTANITVGAGNSALTQGLTNQK